MNVTIICHASFEGPGIIEPFLTKRGHQVTVIQGFDGADFSSLEVPDILISMGGPQSAREYDNYPYLIDEVGYIKKCIAGDAFVLGFCLGAQLIGIACGAAAEKSPEKEIGVYPIELTTDGRQESLLRKLPEQFDVIHWHGDMPGLPAGAVVLAQSEGCPRQMVKFGPRIYGFQCHLEITRKGIDALIKAVPEDLAPSAYTQDKATLLANDYSIIHDMMYEILEQVLQLTDVNQAVVSE